MPSKKKRAHRRRYGSSALPALIAVLAVVAAALVILLMQSDPLSDKQPVVTLPPEKQNFVDQRSATAAPLVLGADAPAAQTAAPEAIATAAPTPEAAPQPENGGNRLIPAPEKGDYFLPVFDRALRTPDDEAMIAITVDDCDDPAVLDAMVDIARKYDVKLTLFPTGEALMDEKMSGGFKTCVRKYGYQLENHCYNHKGEYRLSDSELALQIWKQSMAASYVVGDDYQQHFFRPIYKGSDFDQRTHFFLRKLNYYGVGSYTHSYKDLDAADLADTLENGNIYQFDMTERSFMLFEAFISVASSKGYSLVTMNELFDLPENQISSHLTIDQQTLPTMEDYVPSLYDLKLNYRTHAVYKLQSKLMELGYLVGEDAKSDGLYGPNTSIAVSAFQGNAGLPATGNADVATQEALYSAGAPQA